MKVRCSSLPLLMTCPASGHVSLSVSQAHEASAEGSAVHDAMTKVVHGIEPDLPAIALRFGVDANELGRITWYGRRVWREIAQQFPDPETEIFVRAEIDDGDRQVKLTGHIDVRSRRENVTVMGDWKSGRVDRDYFPQYMGYATCEFSERPECEEVIFYGAWLREFEVEPYVIKRADVEPWAELLLGNTNRPTDFRTGSHCEHCPRSHECPALVAIAKRDVSIFAIEDLAMETLLADMTPAQKGDLYRRSRLVSAFAESLKTSLRREVIANGPMDLGDGTELRVVEEPGQREVDTMKAWPVLEQHFDSEEMARIVSVSVSVAEKLVNDKAPRGQKGKAKAALADELKAAGAITQPTIAKLKTVRKKGIET